MRIRAWAAMLAVFCLFSIVAAQGDNCCGIDRECQTNQEWSDGYWAYQNKECVASASPQADASSSDVDNCCFVDRQCHTNQEWSDGYWAFQNGQCAAPVQSQHAQPQAQTADSSASVVDNCCFIGWECHSNDDWTRGYNAYQNNQCGSGAITNTSIINLPAIEGSAWFRQQVLDAFEFLRAVSPKWFHYTATKIRIIVEAPGLTDKHGEKPYANVQASSGRVQVDPDAIREGAWPLHNVLVHEACHVHQWDSGKYDSWSWSLSFDKEPECYRVQIQALSEMGINGGYIRKLECFAEYHPFESFCGFILW